MKLWNLIYKDLNGRMKTMQFNASNNYYAYLWVNKFCTKGIQFISMSQVGVE